MATTSYDNDIRLGRYANILLDYWFKRTFGEESSKRLLQLTLQEIIPERTITNLILAPQEHQTPIPGRKSIRVDVECTDETGARFVVEMQLEGQDGFYERAVFNSTFAVQEQMSRGETDYLFPNVYFIGILDFTMHPGSDRVRYCYRLREDISKEVMTDRLQYIFLELPNCIKALTPDASVLDNFCYALHNMASLPDKPAGLESELFRLLFESAEIAKFAPKDKQRYINDMTTAQDIKNQIAYARAQGMEKERLIIAKNFKDAGVPNETIVQATGLTPEQVEAL